jgi:uncharacterized protein (UPF0333 family)
MEWNILKKAKKAQSAMEYLMTYGWAILIIAIVLVALYALGVFSGGASSLGTACISQTGFVCQNPVYSHSTGNVMLTVGQASGINWVTANVAFIPTGTSVPSTPTSFPTGNAISGGLASGNTASILLPVSANTIAVGQTETGQIWAEYTTSSGGSSTPYYAEIGTITLKAV